MSYFNLTLGPFLVFSLYAATVFLITLFRPKIGLLCLVPIIGLGFDKASALKGGFVFLVALAVLLNTFITGRKMILSRQVLAIILTLFAFIAWVILRGTFGDEGLAFWAFWVVKRLFATLLLAGLIVFLIRTEKEAWQFIYVLTGFALLTGLVGILQYTTDFQIFWTAREILGVPPDVAYQITGKVRIVGLGAFVVPLAYQLLSLFPISLAYCLTRGGNRFPRFLNWLIMILIFVALVLTFMKSAIGGAVIGGIVTIFLLLKNRLIKFSVLGRLSIITLVFLAVVCFTPSLRNNIFRLGDTSYERIPITLAAVKILAAHPLGVGYSYNEQVGDIYSDISNYNGSRVALFQFPHNIIFGIAVILGLPALLFVVWFYVLLFKGLTQLGRSKERTVQVLAIGLIGSFIAYLINALFHNNNPFFGDTFNWLLIGLTLALINISLLKKPASPVLPTL